MISMPDLLSSTFMILPSVALEENNIWKPGLIVKSPESLAGGNSRPRRVEWSIEMVMIRTRIRSLPIPLLVLIAISVLASACGKHPAVVPSELARTALKERVGPAGSTGPVLCRRDRVCGSDVLPDFYRDRDFRPAWIDDGLTLGDARAFLAALRMVTEDGLVPENYHLSALETLLAEIGAATKKSVRLVRPESLADLEMLLTDGFLLCGSHLVHGQVNPETVQSEWFIKGRVEDLAAVLEKGLAAKDIPRALDSLAAGLAVYRGLMRAYRDYGLRRRRRRMAGIPAGPQARQRGPGRAGRKPSGRRSRRWASSRRRTRRAKRTFSTTPSSAPS